MNTEKWKLRLVLSYIDATKEKTEDLLKAIKDKPNSTLKLDTEEYIKKAKKSIVQAEELIKQALNNPVWPQREATPQAVKATPQKRGRKAECRTLLEIMQEVAKDEMQAKKKYKEVRETITGHKYSNKRIVDDILTYFRMGWFGETMPPYRILKDALPDIPPDTTYYRIKSELEQRY